jgi:hypothetical protein
MMVDEWRSLQGPAPSDVHVRRGRKIYAGDVAPVMNMEDTTPLFSSFPFSLKNAAKNKLQTTINFSCSTDTMTRRCGLYRR